MNDLISRQAAIDVVKGIDRSFVKYIEESPSASCDYICGGKTWDALGLCNARIAVPEHDQELFSCPHCGGNQTERRSGKTVCAYCLAEIR